ncbi:MAG: HupE/UreJ family protein [Vibrio sp.]
MRFWLLLFLILPSLSYAHTGAGSGWLHPLTGLDHLLAMIAVGAWSVQIGKKAVWIVPSAFVCFMFLGGVIGFEHVELPGTEIGIALSVILLGFAICLRQKLPILVASFATGLFGIFHGYAHGYEMPILDDKVTYTVGFLITTACLHLVGAFGAHFLLKWKNGDITLRTLGGICTACGISLIAGL